MLTPRTLFSLCALLAAISAARANELLNGGFESPYIIGTGQTEVAPGQGKLTIDDLNTGGYEDAISGIENWTYGLDRIYGPFESTDVGIESGRDRGDGDLSRRLFVNRHDRPVVQSPIGVSVAAGYTYTLTARSYMELDNDADFKVGVLSLFAGVFQNGNPSDFGGVPLLGTSRMVSLGALGASGDPANDHVTWAEAGMTTSSAIRRLAGTPTLVSKSARPCSPQAAAPARPTGTTLVSPSLPSPSPPPSPPSASAPSPCGAERAAGFSLPKCPRL